MSASRRVATRRTLPASALLLAAALLPPPAARAADGADPARDPIAGAAARIERHRKGDLVLTVRDAAGRPVPGATVRVAQRSHAFRFGCNVFQWGVVGGPDDEALYRDRFAEVFNFATLPFYWPPYEPRPGATQHENREAIARWCRERGITPKGHPLAWNYDDPRWLPDDPAAVRSLQMARIDDVVARFAGLVDVWDVVNEATDFTREEMRRKAPRITAMWRETGQEAFILECFRHARAANPKATLLINDYRTDDAYAALLDRLIARNDGDRPFDAIGIQSHMHGGAWEPAKAWEVCERFARFGVPLHFTETTITSGAPGWELEEQGKPWPNRPELEGRQAREVERFYTVLFSHPAVEAITWWDFADRNAWMGAPAGFLRKDLSPKPAYDVLKRLIRKDWWTDATATADDRGVATVRAFLGTHEVRVEAGGRTAAAKVTLARGAPAEVTLTLP
jgi:GH35 family endo-1,4-beta-xylanase